VLSSAASAIARLLYSGASVCLPQNVMWLMSCCPFLVIVPLVPPLHMYVLVASLLRTPATWGLAVQSTERHWFQVTVSVLPSPSSGVVFPHWYFAIP